MRKKRVVLSIILMMLFLCTNISFAQNQSVVNSTKGVVRVLVEDNNGVVSQGTGFAIGEGNKATTVITSSSLVDNAKIVKLVVDYIGEGGSYIDASVITHVASPDLALLSVNSGSVDKWKPLSLKSAKGLKKSEKVYQLGFSQTDYKVNEFSDKIKSTSDDVTITESIISKADTLVGEIHSIQTESDQKYGYFGGPLVNKNGEVIGVMYYNPENSSTIAYHTDYLFQVLDSNSIKYSKGNNLLIFLIPIFLVAIAAVIIILIMQSKSKKKKQQEIQNNSEDQKTVYINPNPQSEKSNMQAAPKAVGPVIVGVSGYFTGKEYVVTDSIIIGRNPKRAKVIFPNKTRGVSGVHCEVRNVSGRLEVIDLGSTYGTFLSDGTKLKPTMPYVINKGDSFYLGSQENKFQVM